jgi:translation initiation factor 2 beta subunit (eIF-2beta)/eIF-5
MNISENNNFEYIFNENKDEIEERLIKEAYNQLRNKCLNKKSESFMLDPLELDISNNTLWINAKPIIKIMKRPPDHVINFLKIELNTNVNWLDSRNKDLGINIIGSIRKKLMESCINKYCRKYILCGGYSDNLDGCKSTSTRFKYDPKTKCYIFKCKNCNLTYRV